MTDADVFELARAELARARARYPQWPSDLVHAAAIASEESGEDCHVDTIFSRGLR